MCVPHAERYLFYNLLDQRQEILLWNLGLQRVQDHIRRRCILICHQRRNHRQSHHEPTQKA